MQKDVPKDLTLVQRCIHEAASARFADSYDGYPYDHPVTRSQRAEAARYMPGVLRALMESAAVPTMDDWLESARYGGAASRGDTTEF